MEMQHSPQFKIINTLRKSNHLGKQNHSFIVLPNCFDSIYTFKAKVKKAIINFCKRSTCSTNNAIQIINISFWSNRITSTVWLNPLHSLQMQMCSCWCKIERVTARHSGCSAGPPVLMTILMVSVNRIHINICSASAIYHAQRTRNS